MTYRHMIFRLVVFIYCLVVIFILPGLCSFQWYNFGRNNNDKKNASDSNMKAQSATTTALQTNSKPSKSARNFEGVPRMREETPNQSENPGQPEKPSLIPKNSQRTMENRQNESSERKEAVTTDKGQIVPQNTSRRRRQDDVEGEIPDSPAPSSETPAITDTTSNSNTKDFPATLPEIDNSELDFDRKPSYVPNQKSNDTKTPENEGSDLFSLAIGLHYITFIGTAVILLVFILIERICELYYYPDMEILLAVTYALVCFITLIVVSAYIVTMTGRIHYPSLWLQYRCKWYLMYPFTEIVLLLCLIAECCIIYTAIKACRPF